MLRYSISQTLRTSIVPGRRTIATTAVKMAEGDAGAPKTGGAAQRLVVPITSYGVECCFRCCSFVQGHGVLEWKWEL